MKKRTSFLLYGIVLLCALFLLNGVKANEPQLTKVKLQLKWKHQFQFAGYYAAIQQGYYKEAGLDVELTEVGGEHSPLNAISNKSAEFTIVSSDVVLLRSEGHDIVVVAPIFQHSALILLVPTWSGISHVHNLVGKRVMIEDHSADLMVYLNDEGVTQYMIESIPHAYDVDLLVNKQIDAMSAYSTTEPFLLEEKNIEYSILSPRSGGIDFYGEVLVCSKSLVIENSDLVIAFREASLKGWNYALDNKSEVIDLIYNQYSDELSKEFLRFEADRIHDLINHELIEVGYSNPGRWLRIIEVYQKAQMLDKNASIQGLFYSDYIKSKHRIPWNIILIFLVILIGAGLIILFFYRLSQKLKFEISRSQIINQDLQESKELLLVSNEQLNQLSRFKEDMTNMIVHDLKTPLSAIMNIDLYSNDPNWISIIKQSGYKMYNLIQNILDVYKYENSEFDLNLKNIPLVDIINKALDEITYMAEQRNVSLSKNDDIMCVVKADEDIIRRVFANLLSNAVKFSPFNGVIDIYVKISEANQTQVIIANQGIGIPKDKQELIFKKFGQVEKEAEGEVASTGLGLTFCKMAVEAHGGEIGVVSESDYGVEFWFTLPSTICGDCSVCKS